MNHRLETRFTREYGVQHPIVCAGMAFVATPPPLAVAVCEAGGLGSIAVGPLPAETVRGLIRGVKSATRHPFHVNFISIITRPEQIDVCIEEQVPIVSFHWGHPPAEFIERLHAAGVKVWEQIGSVPSAREAVDAGVDLVIAQGTEAGGHNFSTLPTFVLVPEVVAAVAPTLVLAAGGIVSGAQVAAALALGADGVWVGTRFVCSEEAFAHPIYQRRLIEADGTRTRLSSVYGPDRPQFNPMRVLDTGLAREYAGREAQAPQSLESQPVIANMSLGGEEVPIHRFGSFVPTPATSGDIEQMPFLAGQGVGAVKEVLPARAIVESLVSGARDTIRSLQQQAKP